MAATLKLDTITNASNATGNNNIELDAYSNVKINGATLSPAASSSNTGNLALTGTVAMGSSFKRNRIINGNMGVWQRGTSFSLASGSYVYTTDRFFAKYASVGTASQSTDVPTTTGSAFQYSLKLQRNSGQTSTSGNYLTQIIESINCYDLSNQTVTLSFWAKKGADYSGSGNSLSVALQTGTAADQGQVAWWNGFTGNATPINTSVTLTSSWQKFSVTGTCGAGILEAAPYWVYSGQGTAGADDSFYITGVQLEVGSVATPYERQIYSEQLAQCQRYYQYWGGSANYERVGSGFWVTTTTSEVEVPRISVTMRATPTLTYSSVSDWGSSSYNANYVCTAISIGNSSPSSCSLALTTASGVAGGSVAVMVANNTTNARLGLNAEL